MNPDTIAYTPNDMKKLGCPACSNNDFELRMLDHQPMYLCLKCGVHYARRDLPKSALKPVEVTVAVIPHEMPEVEKPAVKKTSKASKPIKVSKASNASKAPVEKKEMKVRWGTKVRHEPNKG